MNKLLLSLAGLWLASVPGGLAQLVPSALPPGFSAPTGAGDSIYPKLGDAGLDVTHYDLTLRSDPRIDALQGRAVIRVTALSELRQFGLDFAGPKVLGVKVDGQAVRHAQVGEKLLIVPAAPISRGMAFTVTVAYSGTPALHLDSSDNGLLRLGWITQAGSSYVLSEPDGSHTYFPCNDVPRDGASYSLHLDVPAGYTAVASGVQTRQTTRAGRTLTDFELDQDIPTYALTVHVGRLKVVTQAGPPPGVTIRNVFPVGVSTEITRAFDRTPAMLTLLSDWFGPYPYPVYGVAVTADPEIPALETATLSTFPGSPEDEVTAVHELSHQWFGNSLRLGDWSDIWLNEGFATYAELLWAESQDESAEPLLKRWYARLARSPGRPLVATRPLQLFDNTSYARGALTLHALRTQVGDSVFRQIIQRYVTRFRGQSVRTSDLIGVVNDVGGPAALAAMKPWIEDRELPALP